MKSRKSVYTMIVSSVALLVLILDANTALSGATYGVEICVRTLIPSLFPFFVLSVLLTNVFAGVKIPLLTYLGKMIGIPVGAESILVAGFLGGYPVGAQCIGQAYQAGQIKKQDALHMLAFCNNAGPAFLFGMAGTLFTEQRIPFVLWIIHILSAISVGVLFSRQAEGQMEILPAQPISQSQAVNMALRSMALVCGWVVLFRVLLSFLQRWLFWLLPGPICVFLSGILELANGCMELNRLPEEELRFLLVSIFLGFGGMCVGMQTCGILGQCGLNSGRYFPGKILHGIISGLMAWLVIPLVFPDSTIPMFRMVWFPSGLLLISYAHGFLKFRKNNSSIPSKAGV